VTEKQKFDGNPAQVRSNFMQDGKNLSNGSSGRTFWFPTPQKPDIGKYRVVKELIECIEYW